MLNQFRPALVLFVSLTVITGVFYPALITGVAALAFPDQATGSVIRSDGKVVGSNLIAEAFTGPRYLWPRPSTANYDGAAGSGSNLGPTNPALREAVVARAQGFRDADATFTSAIPADLVTTSGSGLDPHISLAAAEAQISRIAHARGVSDAHVRELVEENTDGRTLGLLGEPRVNVLRVNLALDNHLEEPGRASSTTADHLGYRWRGFAPDPK